MQIFQRCNNILKCVKFIELQCNILFLLDFGVELGVTNERKKSLKCGRMYVYFSIKTPKAS